MKLPQVVAAVLLISMMLAAGLQADRSALRRIVTEWRLLFAALLANFVGVPILGVLLCRMFHLPDAVATGLLLMAIAPGVPFIILSGGRKSGGSHEFAIALALIMPAIATISVPIAAKLVLPATERPDIPLSFAGSLLLYQLVPLLLGVFGAQRFPAIARRLAVPLGYLTMAALVAILALLLPTMVKSVATVFGTFGLFAMALAVLLSLALGWACGGATREYRRTLAFGTALRNPAIAMIVATTRFPGESVAAAVAAYFVVQVIVTSIAGVFFKRTAR